MTLGEESEVGREKLTFHISPITSHKSSSTPGGGTIISEPGSAADKVARIHSTAGGSPCTSTIFFGANFFAYATSASHVAAVFQDQEQLRRPCRRRAEDRRAIRDSRSRQKKSSAVGFRLVGGQKHWRAFWESSSRWKGHTRVARAAVHRVLFHRSK